MNFTPRKAEDDSKSAKIIQYDSVTKYMAKDLITFRPEQDIYEVIDLMLKHKISGAPVLDASGKLIGLLSEKDCLRVMIASAYHNEPVGTRHVADYMTINVAVITPDKDVLDVANMFLNSNYRRFPVVENGKLLGQVSRRDILRAAKDLRTNTWKS
ncbi:MAG: CBS domain-containing protein [Thermoflexibacter sp.]|jgi:CBS domain-containing protein|nr:CBS domain-containing protein [Thermoflexibacter sp.]